MTKVSARAKRFWDKLRDWYGTALTDQFGMVPPDDWCDIVDGCDNAVMRAAMSEIRMRHTTFPPRLPEFDSIVTKLKRPTVNAPSIISQLADYVLRTRRLTDFQLRTPWLYTHDADGFVNGVVIQADGEHAGHRVTVADMHMDKVA